MSFRIACSCCNASVSDIIINCDINSVHLHDFISLFSNIVVRVRFCCKMINNSTYSVVYLFSFLSSISGCVVRRDIQNDVFS